MSKPTKKGDKESLEDVLYLAARSLGWLIEMTPEEVRESEANFDPGNVVLPEALSDPLAGIDSSRPRSRLPLRSTPPLDTELQESFARAARERRGDISVDIEEKMNRDRERAEAALDGSDES